MKIEKLTASDVEFYRVSIYELMQYDFLCIFGKQADSDFIFF